MNKQQQTLLNHLKEIQAILFVKSSKLTVEFNSTLTPAGDYYYAKIQTPDSLDFLTLEPMVSYCKKHKVVLSVRGSEETHGLTEIEVSI